MVNQAFGGRQVKIAVECSFRWMGYTVLVLWQYYLG